MALQLRVQRSNITRNLSATFVAIFALLMQPLVALNLPAAFADELVSPAALEAKFTNVDPYLVKASFKGIAVDFQTEGITNATSVEVRVQRQGIDDFVKTSKTNDIDDHNPLKKINNNATVTAPFAIQTTVTDPGSLRWNAPTGSGWSSDSVPTSVIINITHNNGEVVSSGQISPIGTNLASLADVMPAPVGPVKNTNTGETFATIQAAVDDNETIDGHEIIVAAKTYNESVNVTKSLTIKGAQTTVDARSRTIGGVGESVVNGGTNSAFRIGASDVKIDGFAIQQTGGSASAISIPSKVNYPNIAISNNVIASTSNGAVMNLYGGQNFIIENNYITSASGQGILLRNGNRAAPAATNQKINNNKFDNIRGTNDGAIVVYGQSGLEIAGNDITSTFQGITIGADADINLPYYDMHDINVHDNIVNIALDGTQPNAKLFGIVVRGKSDGVQVKHNTIKQTGVTPANNVSFGLIRVSYDDVATVAGNPTGLLITENNLLSDSADRYVVIGKNVTNQINMQNNWWGAQTNPTPKIINSSVANVVSEPWLCEAYTGQVNPRESVSGSCATDTEKPAVPIATLKDANGKSVTSGYINTKQFTFKLDNEASEGVTKYQIEYWNDINGSPYTDSGNSWPTARGTDGVYSDQFTQGEGVHYFTFSACDAANNCSDPSAPFKVTYDKTNPSIINARISDSNISNTDQPKLEATVKGTGSPVKNVQYRVHTKAGAEVAGFSWVEMQATDGTFDTDSEDVKILLNASGLADGDYIARVRAFDAAGNKKSGADVAFTVNTAPKAPKNLVWKNSNGQPVAETNDVNGTAFWDASESSDVASYVYKYWNNIEGNQYKQDRPYTVSVNGTSRPGEWNQGEGIHYFCVVAVDQASNESDCSEAYAVTYDTIAPQNVSAGNDQTLTGYEAALAGSASGATSFQWSGPFGANFATPDSKDTTVTMNDYGTYNFTLTAKDAAGNSSSDTVQVTFTKPIGVNNGQTTNSNSNGVFTPFVQDVNTREDASIVPGLVFGQQSNLAYLAPGENARSQDVLASEDNQRSGEITDKAAKSSSSDVLGDEDAEGCMKFLGLCWYWWIPIVAAVIAVIWFIKRLRDEDNSVDSNARKLG